MDPGEAVDVERVFRECRRVREACRASARTSHYLRARYAALASVVARERRRRGLPLLRLLVAPGIGGGAGLLTGARVVLVTDDADLRDLMRLLLEWSGAVVGAVRADDAFATVARSRPDIVLVDLPFEPAGMFALGARLHALRGARGGRPGLVALTKHAHDHPEAAAVDAGFDVQVATPVDGYAFESLLAGFVRRRA